MSSSTAKMSLWIMLVASAGTLLSAQSTDIILPEHSPSEFAPETVLVSVMDDNLEEETGLDKIVEEIGSDSTASEEEQQGGGEDPLVIISTNFGIAVFVSYNFVWLILYLYVYMRATDQYNWEKYASLGCEFCAKSTSTELDPDLGCEQCHTLYTDSSRRKWKDMSELREEPSLASVPLLARADKFLIGVAFLDASWIRATFSCCGSFKCRPCGCCNDWRSWENKQTAFFWLVAGTTPLFFCIVATVEVFYISLSEPWRFNVEENTDGYRDPGPKTFFPFARGEMCTRNKIAEMYQYDALYKKMVETKDVMDRNLSS